MKKFEIIFDALSSTNWISIEGWEEETEQNYGLIQFYSYYTHKTYKILWDNDTIIEFEEVS